MPTPWKRLARWHFLVYYEARKMALDNVLKHGAPLTIREVGRALGMKSKSSLYERCWLHLIEAEMERGRIIRPITHRPPQTDDAASTSPHPSSSA